MRDDFSAYRWVKNHPWHYNDVIMSTIASQITSLTIVYSIVYSEADQRKHQSSASLAFVWGIHRGRWIPRNSPGSVNSPHKWPVTRKRFTFDDVIMAVIYLNFLAYTRYWVENVPNWVPPLLRHVNTTWFQNIIYFSEVHRIIVKYLIMWQLLYYA